MFCKRVPVNFIHVRNLGFPTQRRREFIKFSQADEVLRRDTGYHTCPLGADIAAAARIPFPAQWHSVVAAHRRVAAERDNNTGLGAITTAKPRAPLAPGETRAYPVLPLRDIVVFPHMIVPLFVGRKKSILALEEVMRSDTFILLATQKNASDEDPATEAIYEVGTLASVLQLLKLPDGTVKILVEGAQRAKVVKYTDRSEYYEAEAVALGDTMGERVEAEAFARSATTEFESYVKLNKRVPPEVVGVVQQIEDYAKLADTIASHLAVKIPDRQAILETTAVTERLEKVLGLIETEISVLQVEKRIRTRVKRQVEKTQREFFLHEQMKAIQKEIGDEEGKDELAEIEDKIKKTKLSKEAHEKATHELKKLRQMSPMSAESTVVRNYLDWLLSIPWAKRSKIKKLTGPILCLVGPA